MLARLFTRSANLLVLDEPTNDLDIDTLELLEELVAGFGGTLLLVSHDRAFLDRVVTSLLVLEGDGAVREFVGGWSDWVTWRDERDRAREQRAREQREREREAARAAAAVADGTAAAGASSAAVAATGAPAAAAPPARARKLSYKDQREFEALPAQIEALEVEKGALEAQVAEPSFYAKPAGEVREALARLAALGERIEQGYARWAELEAARGPGTRPD
ncbi:MAG: hypothetical protein U1F11_02960 [Steroidobacteraceae bacterium]